ncbi:uracil-DNA glycosylase [uncultured Thermanaerothrix sp.]|uniref:uracil-DNA glycosylase n=1 Tax=uncultured Thermanaerothrix sp. TaxID=1195149 RepID=UPI0026018978|nr:uracil-DNA glycosylase [uncultured Thermanaerothrix sp.]
MNSTFDISQTQDWDTFEAILTQCRRCERLVAWRERVAMEKRKAYRDWEYWGRPVPGFGDRRARVWVVGLAPGAHGANRTGRMFSGDSSGDFLYAALYRAGFANQPRSVRRNDGLALSDIYISAVCRCAPPQNRPTREEIQNCLPFLMWEYHHLDNLEGIVALGQIALNGVLRVLRASGYPEVELPFSHGAFMPADADRPWVLASYHPSRQNTQTGRLTQQMFDAIWQCVRLLLK